MWHRFVTGARPRSRRCCTGYKPVPHFFNSLLASIDQCASCFFGIRIAGIPVEGPVRAHVRENVASNPRGKAERTGPHATGSGLG